MSIFSVTTSIPSKSGFVWFMAEFEQATLREIRDVLKADGLIICQKLELEHGAGDSRVIRSRQEQLVGLSGVLTITPAHFRVIEPDDR
ncbi:hypothetical protein [Kaistia sp. MMO-174]|uniref:hypothetical protein n=1 Tax=Kaistia sp. MMO-174 TaxID=3081256 RepID=UPI003018EF84